MKDNQMKHKALSLALLGTACISFAGCDLTTKEQPNHLKRTPEFQVHELIINRWSSRAMSGELITQQELMSLFEAAKWAPSAHNNQPWRFLYAQKETPHWDRFFNLLVPFNQSWTKNASTLIVVLSSKNFEHNEKPSRTHSFDTGSACQNLLLQATLLGLVAHSMEGFDYDRARKELSIPDTYDIEAMIAIGKPGDVKKLPEGLQKMEQPSERKSVHELIREGNFTP